MTDPVYSESAPIPLRTGALTPDQISLIFAHLPFDVSFTDSNDEVQFYSEGADRIFERTPDVIGRSVLRCHPPDSVLLVNKILSDFRAGTRDSAEFWIQMKRGEPGSRFVHIRFFAVRDSSGRFQGTIEVVQDVTGIRKLEGERRLLDEAK